MTLFNQHPLKKRSLSDQKPHFIPSRHRLSRRIYTGMAASSEPLSPRQLSVELMSGKSCTLEVPSKMTIPELKEELKATAFFFFFFFRLVFVSFFGTGCFVAALLKHISFGFSWIWWPKKDIKKDISWHAWSSTESMFLAASPSCWNARLSILLKMSSPKNSAAWKSSTVTRSLDLLRVLFLFQLSIHGKNASWDRTPKPCPKGGD